MYSYKKTKENTASPVNEKFENYCPSIVSGSSPSPGPGSSDSSDSESSSLSLPTKVYRQRHISNKDQRFASIALDEASNLHFLCSMDVSPY